MSQFDYAEFKKKAIEELYNGKELSGEDNVIAPLIKDILEGAMKAELDMYLTEDKARGNDNRKNGSTPKTLKTAQGDLPINTPRDRKSSFSPTIIEKQQTFLGETFSNQILSLYSNGLSYRDIQDHIK